RGSYTRRSEQPQCHIMPCDAKTPRFQELKDQADRSLRRRHVSPRVTSFVRDVPSSVAVADERLSGKMSARASIHGGLGFASKKRREIAVMEPGDSIFEWPRGPRGADRRRRGDHRRRVAVRSVNSRRLVTTG